LVKNHQKGSPVAFARLLSSMVPAQAINYSNRL